MSHTFTIGTDNGLQDISRAFALSGIGVRIRDSYYSHDLALGEAFPEGLFETLWADFRRLPGTDGVGFRLSAYGVRRAGRSIASLSSKDGTVTDDQLSAFYKRAFSKSGYHTDTPHEMRVELREQILLDKQKDLAKKNLGELQALVGLESKYSSKQPNPLRPEAYTDLQVAVRPCGPEAKRYASDLDKPIEGFRFPSRDEILYKIELSGLSREAVIWLTEVMASNTDLWAKVDPKRLRRSCKYLREIAGEGDVAAVCNVFEDN